MVGDRRPVVRGRRPRSGRAGTALRGAGAGRSAGGGARACRSRARGRYRLWCRRRDGDAGLYPHPDRALGRLADHVRAYRLRYRACAYRRHRSRRCGSPGLDRGGAPDRRLLPAGPPCVDPALVDRRGLTPRYPRALPRLARAPPARYSRGAQAARIRRVPPHGGRARGARPGRARRARGPQAHGCVFPWPRSGWRISAAR